MHAHCSNRKKPVHSDSRKLHKDSQSIGACLTKKVLAFEIPMRNSFNNCIAPLGVCKVLVQSQ